MVHLDPTTQATQPGIKQVEFNTIASSFGGLSSQVSALHHHLLSVDAYPPETRSILQAAAMPLSNSSATLAEGLALAHAAYGPAKTGNRTCVLFLVQEPERNVFDQRHLEYSLQNDRGVRSFRLAFSRILSDTKLGQDRTLLYTPPHMPSESFEVTVVYFRSGYGPGEYDAADAWDARLHLERSGAIKCPTVLTQLAGCKKVQQVLATPHSPHLSRFVKEPQVAASLLQTFAPIYPMDQSEAGLEARRLATDPETAKRYVLKPQREGGGNNIYRKAIPDFLKEMPETHWPAYILMEMIEPPALKNEIMRSGELQKGGVIGELGVYGVCLWRNASSGGRGDTEEQAGAGILENHNAGYLLRTKGDQSEEGGVAAGFGAVDSCCLVDT